MKSNSELLITKYDLLFESRLTRVESISEKLAETIKENKADSNELLKEMKSDFKWIMGIVILVQGATLGALVKGFEWI